jgi:hypothetical protein
MSEYINQVLLYGALGVWVAAIVIASWLRFRVMREPSA